ncbi:Lipid A biosynthesis acyltransferase [uncultured Sporomusa sp.]|uniref:Lipid A biosynthesis acyltransferase n=1 Tax=uncultured Sporomusa sp. TaxID=307249 RepID=A0A212M1E7_9FIRM|nr:lysophospholipid acyltransferase family protein [uncultured Sporomusa sp.]SCM83595.1 Lipid A biosynthesis acyltransferase [uncultured Sporomusa sp.]
MANEWQYHIWKLASRLVCLLPHPVLLATGRILGRLYYRLAKKQRIRAIEQSRERLGLSQPEAEAMIKKSFIKLGQTFLEVLHMPALTQEKVRRYITIENRHYLEEALAGKKGVVFLTGHLGNWEWFGAALALEGFPVADIIKAQPNEHHTRILNEHRELFGIELFASGTSEIIGAARALKKGKMLAFFADQDAGHDGVFVDFLGKPAATPLGPAVFARKFKAPVVPGFIVRNPDGTHRIMLEPPIYFEDTGNPEADLYTMTERMTRIIESAVKDYPDEWLWFKKRWNTEVKSS